MKTNSQVTKTILKSLLLGGLLASAVFASLASAQSKTNSHQPSKQQEVGPINGGGGYICTNSKVVLKNASTQLANQLNGAADIVFSKLPTGWNRERIIQLVKTVRLADKYSTVPTTRNDKRLRFNFGKDSKGEYIIALEPFCYTYEATPIDFESDERLEKTYRQIQLEMLHEIAHHMRIGITEATDLEARAFAREVLNRLTNHFVICEFDKNYNQDYFPNVSNAAFRDTFVFANLVNKEISFEMAPKLISIQGLMQDNYGLATDSLYANLTAKLRKGFALNLQPVETSDFNIFVSEYMAGSSKIIEIPNTSDLKILQVTGAKLTLSDLVSREIIGSCITIAQPIEISKAKGK